MSSESASNWVVTYISLVQLWLVDGEHFYVGSANFDWRSLTQVKEVGLLVKNCACLAQDMAKIWDVYWALGRYGTYSKHSLLLSLFIRVADPEDQNQKIRIRILPVTYRKGEIVFTSLRFLQIVLCRYRIFIFLPEKIEKFCRKKI